MSDPKDDSVDEARRRLLAMAKYVPPTVLGIISLQQAGCQPSPSCPPGAACNPQSCGPATGCNPDGNPGPCGPDNCGPAAGGCSPRA